MHSVISEICTAAGLACSSPLVPVGKWKVPDFVIIIILIEFKCKKYNDKFLQMFSCS